MRRLCVFLSALLLCGCSAPAPQEMPAALTADSINVGQLLSLNASETFDVLDYHNNHALLLVSDPARENPNDLTDETRTTYYRSFFVLDILTQTVVSEYPLQQYGICTDAVLAWDGVVYTFFTPEDNQLLSSIRCTNSDASLLLNTASVFGTSLRRLEDNILFSDWQDASFGLTLVDQQWNKTELLQFIPNNTEYLSDDFQTSDSYFAYAVKEADQIVFYIGTPSQPALQTIMLPSDVMLCGFDISGETLLVSTDAKSGNLLQFDLSTGEPLSAETAISPLTDLTLNETQQVCGFFYSTLKIFDLQSSSLQEIQFTTPIQGDFPRVYAGEDDFLVQTRSPTALWHISPA